MGERILLKVKSGLIRSVKMTKATNTFGDAGVNS